MQLTTSVIIPTLNRGQLLTETVASILRQTLSQGAFELLLVDSSTDDTMRLIREAFTSELSDGRLRILDERRVGSHYAKNKGVVEARGEILAFLEDDAMAEENWLEEVTNAFSDENIACVGGKVEPIWESTPPDWVEDYREMFTLFSLGDKSKFLSEARLVGCNMAVRRKVLLDVGGYNPDIVGPLLLGDGETGLQRKILAKTPFKIFYNPNARVRHHVPTRRMNFEYLKKRYWNEGACHAYSYFQIKHPSVLVLPLLSAKLFLKSIAYKCLSLTFSLFNQKKSRNQLLLSLFLSRQASYFLTLFASPKFRAFASTQDWIDIDEHVRR